MSLPDPLAHGPAPPSGGKRHGAVIVLLLVHAGMLAWSGLRHSPTTDEVGHLAAGLGHWYYGRFELYQVNPPLVRLVATVPVLFADPEVPWKSFDASAGARPEFDLGTELIAANGPRSLWLFTWARWACIPFSLLGAWVCYRWADELYGRPAGFLAALLWCFNPDILGHGGLITPDVAAAAFGIAAAYTFRQWLRQPRWQQALAAGLVLGLAELTKLTWILLFGLWPLLWGLYRWVEGQRMAKTARRRQAGQLVVLLLLAGVVVNLGYGFDKSFQRLGEFRFVSATLGGPVPKASRTGRNRFAGTAWAAVPVPVPANYLLGIDQQKSDFEGGRLSYLGGQWRQTGWWYYYLYGLAIKVPLGTWVLLLLAALVSLFGRGYGVRRQEEVLLLMPLAVVLAFVSSQTGMTHHLRYVLPIYPFAFLWAARLARCVPRHDRGIQALTAAALLWSVGSSLAVYPHSLSYFNELVGGPTGGHSHLIDSNIDWGQDLLYLKRWLDEHPQARPLGLAYTGYFDPRFAGIEFTEVPPGPADDSPTPVGAQTLGPRPGWYAVSVSMLRSPRGRYSYFLRFRPVAMAGYTIYVYAIDRHEADQVRSELGLLPWKPP
jgi:4-amino-4-deoxy-L-arabinose transferase-like glycosyltransferase